MKILPVGVGLIHADRPTDGETWWSWATNIKHNLNTVWELETACTELPHKTGWIFCFGSRGFYLLCTRSENRVHIKRNKTDNVLWRNNEARSCNHCCSGKEMCITQPECVRVCSRSYPACNAHAPYWHPWPDRIYDIFPRKLTDEIIFGKILLNIKCVFWFSLQLLSEKFRIVRRIQRDITINVHRSLFKIPIVVVVVFRF